VLKVPGFHYLPPCLQGDGGIGIYGREIY
jgi:hypothetical protein